MHKDDKPGEIIFATGRNTYTVTLLWLVVAAIVILIIIPKGMTSGELAGFCLITSPIAIIFTWILLGTKYVIRGQNLHYYCGPFRGKIAIASIRKIEDDDAIVKTSMYKFGLAIKGFIIHYNKFDDIFISPKDKDGFLKVMLEINSGILVVRK